MKDRLSEEEYNRLKTEFIELCREMGVPAALGSWEFSVRDQSGHEIEKLACSSQSWLRNYYNRITICFCSITGDDGANWGDGYLNYRDEDGTINTTVVAFHSLTTNIAGGTGLGIRLGTGTTAETFDDYSLDALIDHGKGAGELYYYGNEDDDAWLNAGWDADRRIFRRDLNKWFMNFSGGNVLVKEAGIIYGTGSTFYPVSVRDVLPATVTIPHLYGVVARYRITSFVFPS